MMPPAQDHRGRSWKKQEGPSLEPRRGRGRERGLGLDLWPQDSERMISVVLGPIYQCIRAGFSRQPWDTKPTHSALSGDDLSDRRPVGSRRMDSFLPATPAFGCGCCLAAFPARLGG